MGGGVTYFHRVLPNRTVPQHFIIQDKYMCKVAIKAMNTHTFQTWTTMRITIDMNNQGHAPQIKCRTEKGTEVGICGHWVHLYYRSETTGNYWKVWENRRVSNCDFSLGYVSGWRVEKWEITARTKDASVQQSQMSWYSIHT